MSIMTEMAIFTCHHLLGLNFIFLTIISSGLSFTSYNFNFVDRNHAFRVYLSDVTNLGVSTYFDRTLRPPAVEIPRRRMELPFSVQLMRSSYNALDELDIAPMDDFQKTFFLFRQSEWEDYRDHHPNIIQGDLADSFYFDFISFAQYAVIAEKCRHPLKQFVEKAGVEGETQLIRRSSQYEDDSLLAQQHSSIVGNTILDFILEKYPLITPRRISKKSSFEEFISQAQQILDVFTINSYAVTINISTIEPAPSKLQQKAINNNDIKLIRVCLRFPANLWSQQVLRGRKDSPCNDFELKVLNAFANKCGINFQVISSSVRNQIDVEHVVKLSYNYIA
eukprot:gene11073-23145_t